jgi:hypothetical protein
VPQLLAFEAGLIPVFFVLGCLFSTGGIPNCSSHEFDLPSFHTLFLPLLFQIKMVTNLKGNMYQLSFVG